MSRSPNVANVTSWQRGSEQLAVAHRHPPAARFPLIRIAERMSVNSMPSSGVLLAYAGQLTDQYGTVVEMPG